MSRECTEAVEHAIDASELSDPAVNAILALAEALDQRFDVLTDRLAGRAL